MYLPLPKISVVSHQAWVLKCFSFLLASIKLCWLWPSMPSTKSNPYSIIYIKHLLLLYHVTAMGKMFLVEFKDQMTCEKKPDFVWNILAISSNYLMSIHFLSNIKYQLISLKLYWYSAKLILYIPGVKLILWHNNDLDCSILLQCTCRPLGLIGVDSFHYGPQGTYKKKMGGIIKTKHFTIICRFLWSCKL